MKSLNKKILFYFIIGIIGVVLFICCNIYNDYDSLWNSLAAAFIFVSALKIFIAFKYKYNENYAKKIDIANNDERNLYISNKAKSLAFHTYLLISACLIIVFRFLEMNVLSDVLAYSICGLVFLYLIFYFVIRKIY